METKTFSPPLNMTWWVAKSEPHPEQPMPVSTLHVQLEINTRQIEISRVLQDQAFKEINDNDMVDFIITEVFNRLYPRERK